LAWGVFLGGLLQFIFQLPFLARAGLLVLPRWAWHDEYIVRIRKLMIPALFGVSVSQINLLLDAIIASFLQDGSVSWLYYSDRLLEFPLGMFGIAIATVILPSLSRLHALDNQKDFRATMDWGIGLICLLGIPSMFGLLMLAEPILLTVFAHGKFTAQDASQASWSLIAYVIGLLPLMLIKVLAPAFYARQDIKTPVRIGIIAMVANMVFNLLLAPFISYVGLALATTLSGALNAWLLYQGLKKADIYRLSRHTLLLIARALAAGLVMAALLAYLLPDVAILRQSHFAGRAEVVGLLVLAAVPVYFVALWLFGVRVRDLKRQTIAESQQG
jgi:putative peptidoglycan lipid II flippase